jgi:dihydroorotate dehydrogenase
VLYRLFFNLVFKRFNPESAHHLGIFLIKFLGATGLARASQLGTRVRPITAMGMAFNGPFGMAAGFDKNAEVVSQLGQLGFSHVEVGTVTRHPQSGNDKPRLFRLVKDRALINRMGFNNDGADAVADRLGKLRNSGRPLPVIGVNIGKSKITEIQDATSDYQYSARKLAPVADYLAVNVSSPNTPGLRSLQAIEHLEPILKAVLEEAAGKPVLVKIAPDLADQDITDIAQLVSELKLAGVIATNTTIARDGLTSSKAEIEACGGGGLSGPVLQDRSVEVLKLLRSVLGAGFTIISVGGVQDGAEVANRLALGANLVQGYTGFVYHGPLWARAINRYLSD